jgi:sucrose phosphorylase
MLQAGQHASDRPPTVCQHPRLDRTTATRDRTGDTVRNQVQLITYADRLAGTLRDLRAHAGRALRRVSSAGVHVLPFFDPIDGADAGFDPIDHREVDPRLGGWTDVEAIGAVAPVMADLIVNHVSARSPQFRDVLADGEASPFAEMFLTMHQGVPRRRDRGRSAHHLPAATRGALHPGDHGSGPGPTSGVDDVHVRADRHRRPRSRRAPLPLVDPRSVRRAWRDHGPAGRGRVRGEDRRHLLLHDRRHLRLHRRPDRPRPLSRVGGARRDPLLLAQADRGRPATSTGSTTSPCPPRAARPLHRARRDRLRHWCELRPWNAVTVLDTHDGIGVVDVGPDPTPGGGPGLLDDDEIDALVEGIHDASQGASRLATGASASNLDIYQVNCTFYDALGADDDAYLIARLVQLFLPGIPQIYYVGLLAGPQRSRAPPTDRGGPRHQPAPLHTRGGRGSAAATGGPQARRRAAAAQHPPGVRWGLGARGPALRGRRRRRTGHAVDVTTTSCAGAPRVDVAARTYALTS